MSPDSARAIALFVTEQELGQPYLWGGDDPLTGFDCSGLVIEGLKAAGRLPRDGDWSANDLSRLFPASTVIRPGVLLFWNRGSPPHIGHVEMVWAVVGPVTYTIGASGGGSGTTTREAAIKSNGYVKIRPAVPGWAKAVDPFAGEP